MRSVKITALFLVLACIATAQHNSDYVQYMFNNLLLNPAYAGSQDALKITALYRKQWIGMNAAPEGVNLSAHTPLKNKRLNLGIVLMNEQFGVYNHTKADLMYAYRFPFLKGNLAFGLQAGADSYKADWRRINTTETGDPNFTPSAVRRLVPTAGAGAYYNSNSFYLGFALPELYSGGASTYYPANLTSGFLVPINEDFILKPALLVKHIKGSPWQANVSTTFYYRTVAGLGLGYTFHNSAMIYMDLRLNDQLAFGYGYAYMLNELKTYNAGTHEIMFRYLFKYKIHAVSSRYF